VFLERAHRRPFRYGGSNGISNLMRLCRTHHVQHDGGTWFLRVRSDGAAVLLDRRGVRVGRLRDEAARVVAGAAAWLAGQREGPTGDGTA
jgi:hypothetical protein